MKNYHFSFIAMLVLLAGITAPQHSTAQNNRDSVKAVAITELISSQHYYFKAQTVTPLSGSFRQLTSDYDLQVSKEKIISQLPYFGRAYTASFNASDGSIQFTAKNFQYTLIQKKKETGWDVSIKFKDANDVKEMQLNIFSNGSATLQVISNNRQQISFNGYIAAPDKEKQSNQ